MVRCSCDSSTCRAEARSIRRHLARGAIGSGREIGRAGGARARARRLRGDNLDDNFLLGRDQLLHVLLHAPQQVRPQLVPELAHLGPKATGGSGKGQGSWVSMLKKLRAPTPISSILFLELTLK